MTIPRFPNGHLNEQNEFANWESFLIAPIEFQSLTDLEFWKLKSSIF